MLKEPKRKKILDSVDYLEQRWQDEKGYEPWDDYIDAMKRTVEKHGLHFVRAGRRPFGCVAGRGKFEYRFFVKSKKLQCDILEWPQEKFAA